MLRQKKIIADLIIKSKIKIIKKIVVTNDHTYKYKILTNLYKKMSVSIFILW